MDGLPSVSQGNCCCHPSNITSDEIVSAEVMGGTSPVRLRPARPGIVPHGMAGGHGEMEVKNVRSATPQKVGVRGVALRLACCEKEGSTDVGGETNSLVQSVQIDSAPRTSYTGILKKLEFMSGGCTGGYSAETLQRDNTRLMFTKLKERLEERGTPVGGKSSGRPSQDRTPVVLRDGMEVTTATKKLMFTMTSSGEQATLPSARYRGSARRVTFGRVSLDEGRRGRGAIIEEEGEESEESALSFQTMTYSAGSTPYSGKTYGAGRSTYDQRHIITKEALASALKKSLTFAGADVEEQANNAVDAGDAGDAGGVVEHQFSFGWQQLKAGGLVGGMCGGELASTPDFSFRTTSRRLMTPPSLSPGLIELHGKARRVSNVKGGSFEDNDDGNAENTPVEAEDNTKFSKFSLPRLDVNEKSDTTTKHPKLLSPTEQGIRDSLKLERTKRLSSSSKFNES